MINSRPRNLAFLGILAVALCSCSGKRDYGKETFPVTGKVHVDGQPAAMLSISLHDGKEMDPAFPALPRAVTKKDGTFAVSTFEAGDGASVGDYVVTFVWGEARGMSIDTSTDRLKGKYSDPEKSEFKVTVKEGEPTDMGTIELTTK